jgi:hypothetical protein
MNDCEQCQATSRAPGRPIERMENSHKQFQLMLGT